MIENFLNYIAFEKRHSPHTSISYKNDLRQFQDFLIETYALHTPEQADFNMIRSWVMVLSELGLEPNSINRKIATLKSFYKFLLRKELIAQNPTLKIKPLKTPKRIPTFLEEASLNQLLDTLTFEKTFAGLRDKLILELLYNTGIRESELLGLTEATVHLYDQTLKVLGKGNKERLIPISRPLCHLIEEYLAQKKIDFPMPSHPYLIITESGEPAYPVLIYRIVKKYLQLVTTQEKKSPHVLRHTFATHLLNKGADLNAIKEILGHTSLKATQIYTHNSLEKLKEAFDLAHPKA